MKARRASGHEPMKVVSIGSAGPIQLAAHYRRQVFEYLLTARCCGALAHSAGGETRRHRIIDARNFLEEARDMRAAASHAGWRIP